jgi:hypothetical protein
MNNPMTFDLIVGLALTAAIVIGSLAGFVKLFLMLLALVTPLAVRTVMAIAQGNDPLASLSPDAQTYALGALGVMSVALLLSVVWAVPGPRSVTARVGGVLFAGALAVFAAGAGSIGASKANPGLENALRTQSLTGRVALAAGNTLETSVLPLLPKGPALIEARWLPKL